MFCKLQHTPVPRPLSTFTWVAPWRWGWSMQIFCPFWRQPGNQSPYVIQLHFRLLEATLPSLRHVNQYVLLLLHALTEVILYTSKFYMLTVTAAHSSNGSANTSSFVYYVMLLRNG